MFLLRKSTKILSNLYNVNNIVIIFSICLDVLFKLLNYTGLNRILLNHPVMTS